MIEDIVNKNLVRIEAYLIDEIVDTCKKENIKYKALKDGEFVI